MTEGLLLLSLGFDALGGGLAFAVRPWVLGRRLALGAVAVGAILAVVAASLVLGGAPAPEIVVDTGLPLGPLRLSLDPLGAFFLALGGLLTVPVMIYADGYLGQHGHAARAHVAIVAGLVAVMTLVVSAADGITFLAAWEMLAWLSYLAVVLEVEEISVARAAFLMLAVSELGTLGLIGSILTLGGGSFDFASLAAGGARLTEPAASLVFIGVVVGFGAKAGLLPLQLWLPEAHPAAPSHVSALLSAVIVKLGVYGLIRFGITFLPHPSAWWGPALITLGAITALVAILWALFQPEIKRILAYSTIENVGLIVAAIGLAETFRGQPGLETLASLALVAALYHALVHALGKGLLFFAAGSVDVATGTRELDRLGGLVKRLPVTSAYVLIGALSLAAVAPLAGYLSEWMILETFLQGFHLTDIGTRAVIVGAGAVLALTAATAVMVYARLFAVAFVGLPRTPAAEHAREAPRSMRLGGLLLVAMLLAVGFLPPLVLGIVNRAATGVVGPSVAGVLVPPVFTDSPGDYGPLVAIGAGLFRGLLPVNGLIVIPSPTLTTINSPTYLTLAEMLLLALVAFVVRVIPRAGRDRRAPVWAGGIGHFTANMEYSGLAYSNPARLIFNALLRSSARRGPAKAAVGDGSPLSYHQDVPPPLQRVIYRPILAGVRRVGTAVKVIQSGDTNQYIAYIFLVVLVVLILRIL
jgi:hydrogenase-4 component B